MSSIIGSIGNFFKGLRNGKVSFDRVGILTDAEELIDTLEVVKTSLLADATAKALAEICSNPRPTTDAQKAIISAHTLLINKLPYKLQAAERKTPFSTVSALAEVMSEDISDIRSHYDRYFDSKTHDIDPDTFRLSTAMVMGYMAQAFELCAWSVSLVSVIGSAIGEDKIPPYQIKTVSGDAEKISQLALDVLGRSAGKTFAKVIAEFRQKGDDVLLDGGSETVSDYSNDSNFSRPQLRTLALFGRGPLNMRIGGGGVKGIEKRYKKYQALKDMREFLQGRVVFLTSQMEGLDPESDEYKRLERIVQGYTAKIAKHDKEIADYEAH